jgi:hypothetical protein
MIPTDKEAKVIDLQSYEFDKTFEKLQDMVSSPDELRDIDIKNIFNALLTVNKNYYHIILRIVTALQLNSDMLEKIVPNLEKHSDMFLQIAETQGVTNDSMNKIFKRLNDHTEMFNMIADNTLKK